MSEQPLSAQSDMGAEPVTVTLPRRDWIVVVNAASDFDCKVPLERDCLDIICAALDQQHHVPERSSEED